MPVLQIPERGAARLRTSSDLSSRSARRSAPLGGSRVQAQPRCKAGATVQVHCQSAPSQVGEAPLGFSFSPGALLLPYHIGVARGLAHADLLTATTPLAGTSAGSIITMAICSGLSWDEIQSRTLDTIGSLRKDGVYGRVYEVLNETLLEAIPEDIHERMNGRATIGITKLQPAKPWQGKPGEAITPLQIRHFFSRDDVITAVKASCWTPGWIGPDLCVPFREHRFCLDGLPTCFFPEPEGVARDRTVYISSSPESVLCTLGLAKQGQVAINPEVQRERMAGKMRFEWPVLTKMALVPAAHADLEELVQLGYNDAAAWADAYTAENAHCATVEAS